MKYDFELNEKELNDSLSIISSRVKPNSVVLEFGCANGRFTRFLHEKLNCTVYAIEIDAQASLDAEPYAEKIYVGDINTGEWQFAFKGILFDYIIFADVLEHLISPEATLKAAKHMLKSNGSMLLSIPNAAHNALIISLLNDEFEYQPYGLLDDTHIRFFTKKSIDQLIEKCDLKTFYMTCTHSSPIVDNFIRHYEELDVGLSTYLKGRSLGEAYQFIVEVKKDTESTTVELDRQLIASIFFDDGGGFNSELCERKKFNPDQDTSIKFTLSPPLKNVRAIRFDPAEIELGLDIYYLKINGQDALHYANHNGERINNFFEFLHPDPQITIDHIDNENIVSVEVGFSSIKPVSNIVGRLKNKYEQEKNKYEQEKIKLERAVNEAQNWEAKAHSLLLKNRIKTFVKAYAPNSFIKGLRASLHVYHKSHRLITLIKRDGLRATLRKIFLRLKKPQKYNYLAPNFSSAVAHNLEHFTAKPLISIIIPTYNTDVNLLKEAINSISMQWYENWELCIVDDGSSKDETKKFLSSIKDPKIHVQFSLENKHISTASNMALSMCSGEYIALMDHDDLITPDALYEIVTAINTHNPDFIYSDEDKVDAKGNFFSPHFKPDFSRYQLLNQNYISHFAVIKKTTIDSVGGFTLGTEGAQDHDLYLKISEITNNIYHIPKVLYHWRVIKGSTSQNLIEKPYAQNAGKLAIENSLARQSIVAKVENGINPGTYRIRYKPTSKPLVSIIVPFKDQPHLLKKCLDSILSLSTYPHFEIIGVSNNSVEQETLGIMDLYGKKDQRISFITYDVEFNYSKINNFAISTHAKGSHLVLLNNDIEIITPDWIEELLAYSERKEIACVGAKLFYPNDTIQHAGVIVGLGGVAGHSHKYFPRHSRGYFDRLNIVQNISAVTAALLMIKRDIFDELGGLNEEHLPIAFNDVDLCLRAIEKGYQNVFTPFCEAYHHESISRGLEDTPEKILRFQGETTYFKQRHNKFLTRGDAFYNPNLTLDSENFDYNFNVSSK